MLAQGCVLCVCVGTRLCPYIYVYLGKNRWQEVVLCVCYMCVYVCVCLYVCVFMCVCPWAQI